MSLHCHIQPYKVYAAVRGTDGHLRITVNGNPLHHVAYHSPTGMEWGYPGSGPSDLALSILANYLGERPTTREVFTGHARSAKLHQDFKFALITSAPYDGFEIHASQDGFFLRMDDPVKGYQIPLEELPVAPDAHLEASYDERFEG